MTPVLKASVLCILVLTSVGCTGSNVQWDFVSHFSTREGKREVSGV